MRRSKTSRVRSWRGRRSRGPVAAGRVRRRPRRARRRRRPGHGTGARSARSSEDLQAGVRVRACGRRALPCRRGPGPPARAGRPSTPGRGPARRSGRRGWSAGRCGWPRRRAGRRAAMRGRGAGRSAGGGVASSVSTSPSTRTRESTSTTRWSQTRSRSETTCEDSRTLSSCSATASIRICRNSRRASGSRLATGSSRISSSGRLARPSVSASWARCPPDSLPGPLGGVEAEPLDPGAGDRVVPARVEPGAEPQVVVDAEPGVGRGVLGDEADLGQLAALPARAPAADLDRARRRRQQPDGQAEQGGLAGAVGADQAGHAPGRDLQRAVRQRPAPAVALAEPWARRTAVTLFPRWASRNVLANSASMLSSSRPARRALASQRRRSRRSGSCAASESSASVRVTKVPTPGGRRPGRRAPARGRP